MSRFQQITKSWSTRRVAAVAVTLTGICGVTILGAIGWRAVGLATSLETVVGLLRLVAAGGIVFVILLTVIGVTLDRALAARAFNGRDLPARPEFYDYDTTDLPRHIEELEGRPLKSLTFTVFDTETTGLRPSQGDEIISIAGIRVSEGVLRRDVSFEAMANPGFSIPKASIRFHGITDGMVADAPSINDVLPEFHAFVGDSILVAHNAAFDMRFLQLKEETSGVAFHQVVLDTLLFSVFLEPDAEAHTLDAIAARLGITVEGRHTAMGDALATAKILLLMLEQLEARGVATLGQAISVSNELTAVRKLQTRF